MDKNNNVSQKVFHKNLNEKSKDAVLKCIYQKNSGKNFIKLNPVVRKLNF
ncbi:hypothetical protein [Haloimpatiens massiliensis]|nr:hypothetical protein [Haloimpatiens massiliensis]